MAPGRHPKILGVETSARGVWGLIRPASRVSTRPCRLQRRSACEAGYTSLVNQFGVRENRPIVRGRFVSEKVNWEHKRHEFLVQGRTGLTHGPG